MAGWRRAVELAMTAEEIETLTALSRSRTEAARGGRRRCCSPIASSRRFCQMGQRLGVHHQTVQRCVERALAYGALAALADRPRPGKEPKTVPRRKRKPGRVWRAIRPRSTAIRTNCGRRGFWPVMRARTRTGRRARMSRQTGTGNGVQDTRPRGNQAAEGTVLSGTSRRRVRAEDGGGSERLPRGPGPEKGRRQIEEVGEVGSARVCRRCPLAQMPRRHLPLAIAAAKRS